MIGQTIAHYKILERLVGAGKGVVCKARDLNLDRPVVLKFLPPDLPRAPETQRRSTHEVIACGDGMAGSRCKPATISMIHATIAIGNLAMKRPEKALSGSCRCLAATFSWHEEVFRVSTTCSDTR